MQVTCAVETAHSISLVVFPARKRVDAHACWFNFYVFDGSCSCGPKGCGFWGENVHGIIVIPVLISMIIEYHIIWLIGMIFFTIAAMAWWAHRWWANLHNLHNPIPPKFAAPIWTPYPSGSTSDQKILWMSMKLSGDDGPRWLSWLFGGSWW